MTPRVQQLHDASAAFSDAVITTNMHPSTAPEWQAAIATFDDLPGNLWRQLKRCTGRWRDRAIRKRKTEVDMRVTDLGVRGRALGLPMPLDPKLADMIQAIEDGQRAQSWANLDEIGALARELGRAGEGSLLLRSA